MQEPREMPTVKTSPPLFDVASVRADFPILERQVHGKPLIYLDNAASSQKPTAVIDAIADYYRTDHSNIHRGVHFLSAAATERYEQVRRDVQQFLNAEHDHEIIFTRGTTDAINLVATSYGREVLREGDEVLLSTMEHHSNIVPWQQACAVTGARLRVAPIDANGDIDMVEAAHLITEKTRIASFCHISNALGTINPIAELIEKCHAVGARVLVDGAQATPHLRPDVRQLNADFYAFSGHKVYGPTGIGVLYGKAELLDAMPPYQGGGDMIKSVSFEFTEFNDLPFKFEAGTPNIAGVMGLGAALAFISDLGHDAVAAHEAELLAHATEQLLEIDGMRLIGTAKKKASVISFLVGSAHPYDVGTLLDQMGIAVRTGHHCTEPLMNHLGIPGTVRASFAAYNTLEEADALVAGVRRAAAMLL
ncbi:cysteine desulfurase [soil metagenome]